MAEEWLTLNPHTYIHTHIHACLHTYTHIYMHTYTYTYMHTYIHFCNDPAPPCRVLCMAEEWLTPTHIHTRIHTCVHTYIRIRIPTYIYAYMQTCIHFRNDNIPPPLQGAAHGYGAPNQARLIPHPHTYIRTCKHRYLHTYIPTSYIDT